MSAAEDSQHSPGYNNRRKQTDLDIAAAGSSDSLRWPQENKLPDTEGILRSASHTASNHTALAVAACTLPKTKAAVAAPGADRHKNRTEDTRRKTNPSKRHTADRKKQEEEEDSFAKR